MRLISRGDGVPGAQRYAQDLFRPLVEHDAETGGMLVATILAFVRSGGQVRTTAATLHVHENTVRYRLNRIAELSSIDPERFDSLLSVALAMQIHVLYTTEEATSPLAEVGYS